MSGQPIAGADGMSFALPLDRVRRSGGIGRRDGLKNRWGSLPVWVQVPPPAPLSPDDRPLTGPPRRLLAALRSWVERCTSAALPIRQIISGAVDDANGAWTLPRQLQLGADMA